MKTTPSVDPIEDLVGELFVDREEELNLFEGWVEKIPKVHLNSYALIGRRRTGKTALLVKFFNKLFHEQDRVIPVFISFARYMDRTEPITYYDFSREYFTGYLRCYLAFRYKNPIIISERYDIVRLKQFASHIKDDFALEHIEQYELIWNSNDPSSAHGLAQWVINFPSGTARIRNMPTAIIVDEFQVLTKVYDPKQNVHHCLTDSFQNAMETKWAPMIVSGSAVSLLVDEALSGMLSGRYRAHYLKPLDREYAYDLVFRIADVNGTTVNEAFAETVFQLTSGYPHAIFVLMNSPHPDREKYPSLSALESVMTYELTDTRGSLWQHFQREFRQYGARLNHSETARKVMLWATKYPEKRIDVQEVAKEIGAEDRQVQQALEKLQWIDAVERAGMTTFKGPDDPMLRRYIEYQHYTEVEKLGHQEAVKEWEKKYKQLQGKINNFVGEMAEVYVEAVMRAFSGQEVDGDVYFNTAETIVLPKFDTIERRGGIVKSGRMVEIDLTGEASGIVWLVQVKYHQSPIGVSEIEKFMNQTETVITEKKYASVVRWHFCKQGYTAEAEQYMKNNGIRYSGLAQFNALAKLVGFFGLPE